MLRKILIITACVIVGTIIGVIAGLFIGIYLGGNFFTDFEMFGVRGYEAAGNLGTIIGGVLGIALGIFVGVQILRSKKRRNNA